MRKKYNAGRQAGLCRDESPLESFLTAAWKFADGLFLSPWRRQQEAQQRFVEIQSNIFYEVIVPFMTEVSERPAYDIDNTMKMVRMAHQDFLRLYIMAQQILSNECDRGANEHIRNAAEQFTSSFTVLGVLSPRYGTEAANDAQVLEQRP